MAYSACSTERWDADEVRDDLRAYVVEHLGDPAAVLVVDETGFLKKGEKSVGVARQYSGRAGKVENCQIGVFLAYATPRGERAFLDRALYLPEEEWAEDGSRREAAGVPEEVRFATKGVLARKMIERALEAEVPASWVTADEVYGNDGALRRWLEAQGRSYVLAVSRLHPLATLLSGSTRAEEIVAEAPPEAWQRLEVGSGSKGMRLYEWARARLPYITEEGWTHSGARAALGEFAGTDGLLPSVCSARDASRGVGPSGGHPLEHRGVLRAGQGGSGPRSLRGQALEWLASAHHPLPAGACLPRSDAHPRQRRGGKRGHQRRRS
jgi:hypothetical protein